MVSILRESIFIGLLISFGAFIFVLTLINLKVSIFLLFFAVALSPKINVGGIPLRVEDFFMIILIFSWFARLAIKKEKFPSTSLNWPIFIYLFTCFISTAYGYYNETTNLLSADPSMSAVFHFFKKIQAFIMAYIIAANINTKKDVIQFIRYILIASTILAIYGVKQGLLEYRISGPMGEGANTFGMYFVFITIFYMGLFFYKQSPLNKLYLGVSIVLFIYVMMGTLSRVSYVSFSIIMLFLGFFKEKRFLFLFLLLLIFMFLFFPGKITERALTIKNVFDSGEYFHSWEARKWAWHNIPSIVLNKSPLLGFGLASAPLCYAESEYVADFYFTGILGILAFIWLYVRILKMALFVKQGEDLLIKNIGIYFIAALSAFLIGGISGPVFTAIRTANIFWIFVGLLAGIQNLMIENKLKNERPT